MGKRMILFDLDGTLLTSDGVVAPLTANWINFCKSSGYYIGYITARSRSKKTVRLLDGLPCDYIAFYNGAAIYADNQLIDRNELPYQQAKLILQRLNRDYPDMIIDVHQEHWTFSNTCDEVSHSDLGNRITCGLKNLTQYDIQRIRLRSHNLMSVPLEKYMTTESMFYHTVAGDAIIVHKRANKALAAKRASEYFGISTTQMIAFGDDLGDIDMIKFVGTGVAMGNAVPSLKEIANYVTDTNDNNGIACWLNKYLIN